MMVLFINFLVFAGSINSLRIDLCTMAAKEVNEWSGQRLAMAKSVGRVKIRARMKSLPSRLLSGNSDEGWLVVLARNTDLADGDWIRHARLAKNSEEPLDLALGRPKMSTESTKMGQGRVFSAMMNVGIWPRRGLFSDDCWI